MTFGRLAVNDLKLIKTAQVSLPYEKEYEDEILEMGQNWHSAGPVRRSVVKAKLLSIKAQEKLKEFVQKYSSQALEVKPKDEFKFEWDIERGVAVMLVRNGKIIAANGPAEFGLNSEEFWD